MKCIHLHYSSELIETFDSINVIYCNFSFYLYFKEKVGDLWCWKRKVHSRWLDVMLGSCFVWSFFLSVLRWYDSVYFACFDIWNVGFLRKVLTVTTEEGNRCRHVLTISFRNNVFCQRFFQRDHFSNRQILEPAISRYHIFIQAKIIISNENTLESNNPYMFILTSRSHHHFNGCKPKYLK